MAFWDKEESIISVQKNKSENVEVKYVEKNDKGYVDVRISKADREGEFHPTSNGVAIPVSEWNKISDSVKEHLTK